MGLVARPAPSVDQEDEEVPIPLVYALLSDKSENAYSAVFSAVKEEATQQGITSISPVTIMMDFELATKKAATTAFPLASVK